jgi:hypothetical protein
VPGTEKGGETEEALEGGNGLLAEKTKGIGGTVRVAEIAGLGVRIAGQEVGRGVESADREAKTDTGGGPRTAGLRKTIVLRLCTLECRKMKKQARKKQWLRRGSHSHWTS